MLLQRIRPLQVILNFQTVLSGQMFIGGFLQNAHPCYFSTSE